jgi:signal transduction histidine kinase
MGAGLNLAGRRRDGSEFPAEISLSAFETEDGVIVSAAIRDVSDRKRIEAEREQLQVRQSERLEILGQLAGGVAHDFNNLLGVILMYASFVADGLRAGGSERSFTVEEVASMESDVRAVQDVAGRAAALTHKLLTFGRRELVAAEVLDVNEVVREMEDLLRRTMGENVDDLRTVLADRTVLVKADRGQLDQVMMNLAVNARDAMPGGGTLEVTTAVVPVAERSVLLRTLPAGAGDYARLRVSDTGAGMSPEVAARAFDPFFTTKGVGSGSGLGLATVYGIVKQAGGDVTIASTPGTGTTVTVLLPITSEPRSARPVAREAPAETDGSETVLLVEDEVMFQQPAMRILTAHGYRVLAASNAADALRVARDHDGEIHLLVTDIVMPGPSGQHLARELGESRPGTRVLFMSGYGWDTFDLSGPNGGARLLDKPFSAAHLLRDVRATLDQP